MLAVSQHRTVVWYQKRHYCKQHKKLVDREHINECTLISCETQATKYNQDLERTGLKSMSRIKQFMIMHHYNLLRERVQDLVNVGTYIEVDAKKEKTYIRKKIEAADVEMVYSE